MPGTRYYHTMNGLTVCGGWDANDEKPTPLRDALKKKKTVKLVTLSKKVGRGQDQITIFSPSKIVTCLIGGGVCSSNVTISFSTFYGILRL